MKINLTITNERETVESKTRRAYSNHYKPEFETFAVIDIDGEMGRPTLVNTLRAIADGISE